jgi:hypothetical protein
VLADPAPHEFAFRHCGDSGYLFIAHDSVALSFVQNRAEIQQTQVFALFPMPVGFLADVDGRPVRNDVRALQQSTPVEFAQLSQRQFALGRRDTKCERRQANGIGNTTSHNPQAMRWGVREWGNSLVYVCCVCCCGGLACEYYFTTLPKTGPRPTPLAGLGRAGIAWRWALNVILNQTASSIVAGLGRYVQHRTLRAMLQQHASGMRTYSTFCLSGKLLKM